MRASAPVPAAAPSSRSVKTPSPGAADRVCGGTNEGGGNGGPDKLGSGGALAEAVGAGGVGVIDEADAIATGTAVCRGLTASCRGGGASSSRAGALGPQAPSANRANARNPQLYHLPITTRPLARVCPSRTWANSVHTYAAQSEDRGAKKLPSSCECVGEPPIGARFHRNLPHQRLPTTPISRYG